ncbi:MAG: hypothetical protein RMK57_10405 [Bryobacterales bacterium]|nr:hypothetical protein [Bryobacteraceae bacterium]MDW8354927.1 hypothetical protein [Bryobacterales bacterium]
MNNDPKLLEELRTARREPLAPVEKALIRWSLGLGLTLTALLAWLSRAVAS